jgi:hypothetical protein
LISAVAVSAFHPATPDLENKGFALVELFTSEGCSSCPAADEAIGRIQDPVQNVFILCFHVDYWNYLGWKDLYSNPAYSARQQEYGNLFHLNSIYTPQVVVNGQTQFVGSDEVRLRSAIASWVKEAPKTRIQIRVQKSVHGQVPVSCILEATPGNILHLALVQKTATDFIQRGENKGRTLKHYFIVRDFTSLPCDKLSAAGIENLGIPPDQALSDCEVIAFVQNAKTGQVLAAARAPIPE